MILSLGQIKSHLRVIDTDEDAQIELYMGAAQQAASDFLNRAIYSDQVAMDAAADTTGVIANDAINAAVLLIIGKLYAFREDVAQTNIGNLPDGSRALLMPYRTGLGV